MTPRNRIMTAIMNGPMSGLIERLQPVLDDLDEMAEALELAEELLFKVYDNHGERLPSVNEGSSFESEMFYIKEVKRKTGGKYEIKNES